LIGERLSAQLLAGPPARGAVEVTGRLLAVQAQDPRGARLAIRARIGGGSASDIDRALSLERSLVITWLNRGTLHLVCTDDYPWLQKLTTPPLATAGARRLAQHGVAPAQADRALPIIERAVRDEGPLTRRELGDRIARARIAVASEAILHLLFSASLRGILVRGPMRGRQHAYVHVADWLEPPSEAV
jgi:hypothetical protein